MVIDRKSDVVLLARRLEYGHSLKDRTVDRYVSDHFHAQMNDVAMGLWPGMDGVLYTVDPIV